MPSSKLESNVVAVRVLQKEYANPGKALAEGEDSVFQRESSKVSELRFPFGISPMHFTCAFLVRRVRVHLAGCVL